MLEVSATDMAQSVTINKDYSIQDVTRALLAQVSQAESKDDRKCTDDLMEDEESDTENYEAKSLQSEKGDDQFNSSLKDMMIFVSHNLTILMKRLQINTCDCAHCAYFHRDNPYKISRISEAKAQKEYVDSMERNQRSSENGIEHQPEPKIEPTNNVPFLPVQNHCEALFSQLLTNPTLNPNLSALASLGMNMPSADALGNLLANNAPNPGGRRSKYCSNDEKKAVAEYANVHGASAAARKFNIPPPIAAYYHRKEFKPTRPVPTTPARSIDSPGTASGDDVDSGSGDWNSVLKTAANTNNLSAPAMVDVLKQMDHQQRLSNPAHSSGSPGFLRGRGRGRPKLIGDELDAELVDYMVQIKQKEPRGHLTATHALEIAKNYILQKAPGLLEEHGGQVKLKLTWAMKLVSRIGERQKEIELGLPAGTLSNMSKNQPGTSSNLPGGSFMGEMLSQNYFNQQMTQLMSQALSASYIPASVPVSTVPATPQIVNVRELTLPQHENDIRDDDGGGEIPDLSSFEQAGEFVEQHDENMEVSESSENLTVHSSSRVGDASQFNRSNAF